MDDRAFVDAMRDALRGRGIDPETAEIQRRPGPAGTTVIGAVAPDAYPGAGIATAVVAQGVPYAAALDRGIAALAAVLGWFDAPPAPAELLDAVSATDFDGLLAADGPEPLRVEGGDALTLTGTVRRPFDEEPWHLHLRVGRDGARISLAPLSQPQQGPVPIDAVTAAIRALDGLDAEAMGAVHALAGSRDPRAITALVRATARPTEGLWVQALSTLPPDLPGLAAALAAAWAPLGREQAAERVAVAEELYGSAFAGALRTELG